MEPRSPFLDRELFVDEADAGAEPRAEALAAWSPFRDAEAGSGSLFEGQGGVAGGIPRSEVPDTTIAPFKWICSVSYERGDTTLDGGTGFLISDRHVLTARHVLTDLGTGPNPPDLAVYPGRHFGGKPFGRFHAVERRVSNVPSLDFALITLDRPVDPGLQWWGHPGSGSVRWTEELLPLNQLRRAARRVETAGYPESLDALRRRMFGGQGDTDPAAFHINFRHTAHTTKGQSGSPIWTAHGGRFLLLGIATSFDETSQRGLLLHPGTVMRQVAQWMKDDAPKPKVAQRRTALERPHRWVCRLEVRDDDLGRTVGHGTGLMVSARHVLTSARVIHAFVRDRRRYSVRITPGYEFGREALGSTTASGGRVSPGFAPDTKDAAEDYGLLTMTRPLGSRVFRAIGKAPLGSWGEGAYGYVESDEGSSGQVRVAAFSRLSGGGGGYHQLRVATGAILRRQGGVLLHDTSEKLDAPGAPIWVEKGERRLLAGIATSLFAKESGANLGCALGEATKKQIREWIAADGASRELESPEDEADLESWVDEIDEADEVEPEIEEQLPIEELGTDEIEAEEAEGGEGEEESNADEEGEEPQLEEDTSKPPAPASGNWLTPLAVKETTIPKYRGRATTEQPTGCAIYVPGAASKQQAIDLLVFFHGDPGGCSATSFDPAPASRRKFRLDAQIEASGKPVALAVPQVHWRGDDTSQIQGKWSASNLNRFVEDVLAEIGSQTSMKRTLRRLIIAGHSRAYNILTPLALEFHQRAPATTEKDRPLQRLAEVWSLDANYDVRDIRGLDVWAAARPTARFVAVHSPEQGHAGRWAAYYRGWALLPNLKGCLVGEKHCVIPTKYVQNLLATDKDSGNWCTP